MKASIVHTSPAVMTHLSSRRSGLWLLGLIICSVLGRPVVQRLRDAVQLSEATDALEELDYPRALRLLESLHASSPDRADVAYALARAYRRSDRNEEFRSMLAIARQTGWPENEIQRQVHLNRVQSGGVHDFADYRDLFEQSLAVDETVECYEALAKGFLGTLRYDEALVIIKEWIAVKPLHAEPHLLLAEVHERRQCRGEAQAELSTVLALDPNHRIALSRLGNSLLQTRDFVRAHEVFCQLAALEPNSPQAIFGIAFSRLGMAVERNDDKEALSALESAVTHTLPDEYRAVLLFELGSVMFRMGDNASALRVLKEARELTPGNPGISNLLGVVWRSDGRHDLADAALEEAKTLRNLTQRLSYLIEQIQISPNDIPMRLEAIVVASQLGRVADAVQLATNALLIDPKNLQAHRFLMEHYTAVGNIRRAEFHQSQVSLLEK